ncbi:MAG: tRNA (adenosine(37)-N6)-threonylcarbamoyltransferase complex ATPase subunit type 1 TsaE [Actinomycetota bacterium]|nr:tRNA (adenosine(37)-N6)-threonylcarbamoyltransferase complex ATPase subunit type 1 TsaE [Actinomycetota bacterium]
MIHARTKSVEETRTLAAELAPLLQAGDLILLAGNLGTGKTAFVQGLARGLGIVEPVVSPSFVLVRTYEGRLPLNHVDVYRLESMQELVDLGMAELLDEGGVTAIEWGDVVLPGLPAEYLEVRLEPGEADDDRELTLFTVGASWGRRTGAIQRAVERWTVTP